MASWALSDSLRRCRIVKTAIPTNTASVRPLVAQERQTDHPLIARLIRERGESE